MAIGLGCECSAVVGLYLGVELCEEGGELGGCEEGFCRGMWRVVEGSAEQAGLGCKEIKFVSCSRGIHVVRVSAKGV